MVGGNRDSGPVAGPAPAPAPLVDDRPVMLGVPYKVGDTSYTPADVADYDAVGYASRYGDDHAGKPTANGEDFDPAAISAAHKTLPLPSYVEVTALDTGRTILVRVNDRGPMANDRLIDLSPAAADQLGLKDGVTGVRVRRVHPPRAERLQLRAGQAVPDRLATPDSLLAILRRKLSEMPRPAVAAPKAAPAASIPAAKPATPVASPPRTRPGDDRFIVEGEKAPPTASAPPKPTAAKPAATARHFVQVATFSAKANAEATAKTLGGTVSAAGRFWRVRTGPFASEAEAQAALAKAKARGFRDARVERGR